MGETYSEIIIGLLTETEALFEQIDKLLPETAVELYEMLETASHSVSKNIAIINPELRAEICNRLDCVLERIIDIVPFTSPNYMKLRNIYTPAVQCYRRWKNVELLKDKGLVGYTLANEIGARSFMYFGTSPSDYPYLSNLPRLEILYHDVAAGTANAYYSHLKKYYSEIDALILHGMYGETIPFLNEYRQLRLDGKVYCGLDMNSHWMSRTDWNNPAVHKFANQCDIIATSCRSLRDTLNKNPVVNFSCRWFPNGFFNPTGVKVVANPLEKENIILTVGRIGTAQKNNEELLIAFAGVSNILDGWKVRLVGSIEPEFQKFINYYFSERPDLKKRVIFTGAIENKDDLYKEYAKAKLFVLTSQIEGGTPNVYAEALFHGCMFVTSDIDAADDITNYGELGIKYPLGNIEALSSALTKICLKADKQLFENYIPKALLYANKHYDWFRNAKKLAYMLSAKR